MPTLVGKGRPAVFFLLPVEALGGIQHVESGEHRLRHVVLVLHAVSEQRHDRVVDVLVDDAVPGRDDVHHPAEIPVQLIHQFLGIADRFGNLGESVDVRKQHDDEPFLSLENRPGIAVRLLDDVGRNIRLEGRKCPFDLATFDAGGPRVPPDLSGGGFETLDHQVERLRQLPDLVAILDLHPLTEIVRLDDPPHRRDDPLQRPRQPPREHQHQHHRHHDRRPQDDQRPPRDLVHPGVERRTLLRHQHVPPERLEPEPLPHPLHPPRSTVR